MMINFLLVVVAYLLGSIPFGFILIKYVFTSGEDIRHVGSGSIGATNVTRRAGKLAGILTYSLDVAKGAAAILLIKQVTGDYYWIGAAAIAAILGHVFPILLKFKGGKGVATGVGVFLILAPLPVLSTLVLWLMIVLLTRTISFGSIIASIAVPFWILLYYGWLFPDPNLKSLVIIAIIGCGTIVATHHQNIRRLINGTENKIGKRIAAETVPGEGGDD